MKKLLILFALFMFCTPSNAGVVGSMSQEVRDWNFIQKNGGLKIAAPIMKSGKRVLPVTCYIAKYNSGLIVHRIEVKRKDKQIAIRIFTSLPEKDSSINSSGFVDYADIADIPVGKYDVYYEYFGDRTKYLGEIEVK